MKICGIIAEFNPLHNGHKYLIDKVKKDINPDFLIVVMSGNFVQRGEFAIIDKWDRTKLAIKNGIDLVVELPFQYSVAPAHIFAEGAIEILNNLRCTDIVFGTEDDNFDYIKSADKIINSSTNSTFLNYRKSYANQINNHYKKLDISINNPNQMLGLNYVIQIRKNKYSINPVPIKRIMANHDSTIINDKFTSASNVRKMIINGDDIDKYVPVKINNIIQSDYFKFLKYKIISSSTHELSEIYQVNEGIEYKIKKEIKKSNSIDELLQNIKSNRYTYSRLRRIILYIFLNVKDHEVKSSKNFIHVLGFNEFGQKYLNLIKNDNNLPLITKVSKKDGSEGGILELQVKVDSIFSLFSHTDQNFQRKPVMEL